MGLSGIRRLTVVVDAGNGMAGHTVPAVFAGLPLDLVPLYFELDGTFPHHEANPIVPENLRDLSAAVRTAGADVGLAFDGDADRCFVVDERGEVVVLHFWTTWCLECRDEVPGLAELAGEGVIVLGIDAGEPMSRVESAADDLDIPYPVLVDADAEVALAYGVTEYPATVVIDAGGIVRAVTYGPVPIAALAEQVTAAGS